MFRACDTDGTGSVDKHEMRSLIRSMCLLCHELYPEYTMVKNEKDAELYADMDTQKLAQLTANKMVFEIFTVADKDRSGTIELNELIFWLKRGGKTVNEFQELFPVFDVFTKQT